MLRPQGLTCDGNVTERPLTPAPVSFVKGVTEGGNLEAWTGAGGSKGKMLKISNKQQIETKLVQEDSRNTQVGVLDICHFLKNAKKIRN